MNFPTLPTDNLWKFLVIFCLFFQMYYWYNTTGIGGTNQLISIRNKLTTYATLFDYVTEKKKELLFVTELYSGLEENASKATIQKKLYEMNAERPPSMDGLYLLCQLKDTSTLLLSKRLELMASDLLKSEDDLLRVKVTKEEMDVYKLLRGSWPDIVQFIQMGISLLVLTSIWNHRTQRHQDRLLELQVNELEKKLNMP